MTRGRGSPFKSKDPFHARPDRQTYDSPIVSSPIQSSVNEDDSEIKAKKDIIESKSESLSHSGMFSENQDDKPDAEQAQRDLEWEEYRDHPQPVQIPQSFVYELILKNVYKEQKSFISFPT